MASSKLTGKAGTISLEGSVIPFKVISVDGEKEFHDATDSDDYDTVTAQLYRNEIPGMANLELEVEFLYDNTTLTGTKAKILDAFIADLPLTTVVTLNATTTILSGDFNMTNINLDINVNDIVGGSATLRNKGKFQFSAPA